MNNSFQAENFETDPKFENIINDIRDNHLEIITSAATNPSTTKPFDENFDTLCINNSFESAKF